MTAEPAAVGAALTVVVLTHNRRAELADTLGRLRALPSHPPLVVVDNGSSNGTADVVRRTAPEARLVRPRKNLGAAARNRGVAASDTRYVAFCDDDCSWLPGSLPAAVALLDRHPQLAAVTARIVVGEERREDPASAEMAASPLPRAPGLDAVPVLGLLAGATVVRREAFDAVGGFDARLFLGGEEELLALDLASAGWTLVYSPDVVVHHRPSPHRDRTRRSVLLVRNGLWVAWLRYPLPGALRRSRQLLRRSGSPATKLAGLAGAVGGLAWVLRDRAPVRSPVREQLLQIRSEAEAAR